MSRGYRSSAPRPARWLELRYPATCCRCGAELAPGARAFYNPADRSTCCPALDCAEAHGLTELVWRGSPVSGSWVRALTGRQIGAEPLP